MHVNHKHQTSTSPKPAARLLSRLGRSRRAKAATVAVSAVVAGLAAFAGSQMLGGSTVHTASGSGGPAAQLGTGAISGGVTRLGGTAQAQAPSVVASGGGGLGPGHGAFDAITCVSATKCLAVGAGSDGSGVVGVTIDGAATWSAPKVPAGTPLLDGISCGDSSHCVAVGQGTLLVTADGGSTWAYQAPPTAQTTLLGVACNSANSCVATGVSPNRTGPYFGQMVRSTDGGATWSVVVLPAGMLGLGSVSCPTTTFCVAVGVTVMVSNDGGQTWVQRGVNGGMGALSSVSCADGLHCVAVGANPQLIVDPKAAAFGIATTDGGNTWTRITLPAGSATAQTIACSTDGACLAAGPAAAQGGTANLQRLDPTGAWSSEAAPSGMTDITGVTCRAPGSCVAVGVQGHQPLSVTTSNGLAWTPTPIPFS
ncbi:MAG: exo-alpha-sialidase [Acidimicrobiales bacterium]|nr:exo-alpha-sialidase [Acidimicrobiales bacterium]